MIYPESDQRSPKTIGSVGSSDDSRSRWTTAQKRSLSFLASQKSHCTALIAQSRLLQIERSIVRRSVVGQLARLPKFASQSPLKMPVEIRRDHVWMRHLACNLRLQIFKLKVNFCNSRNASFSLEIRSSGGCDCLSGSKISVSGFNDKLLLLFD